MHNLCILVVMGELKLNIPDEVERKFRNTVSEVYGDEEDAFEQACRQAITEWTNKKT